MVAGWLERTKQNIGMVVADLIYSDSMRKLNGVFLLLATALLLWGTFYAGQHANMSVNRFTHIYTTKEIVSGTIFVIGLVAAMCTGLASFVMLRFTPMAYSDFANKEAGFGWNLEGVLRVLGKKLDELNVMTRDAVWTIADKLLVIAAKNVLIAERAIKKKFEGDYRKINWKYDPAWDGAKKYFEQIYYMFERFDLADPEGFDSYYNRARVELELEDSAKTA